MKTKAKARSLTGGGQANVLFVRLDSETMAALEAYEADLAKKLGGLDLVPSRTAIGRALIRRGLGIS